MGDGKHCPACGEDIGVRSIMVAGLPNRISCPGCGTRLRYRRTVLLQGGALILAVGCLGLVGLFESPIPAFAAVVAAWMAVERAIAWHLRRSKTLEALPSRYRRRVQPRG